jgi:hypothetical protein
MEWRRPVDVFVTPGHPVPTFLVDYEVTPRAKTVGLRVSFDFDASHTVPGSESTRACPSTVTTSQLSPTNTVNDVVRAIVSAVELGGGERLAEVHHAVGSRSLVVNLPGFVPGGGVGNWYVVVEPMWGEPRAVLVPITAADVSAQSIVVSSLPEGELRVQLVKSRLIEHDAAAGLVFAPHGYSGHFGEASVGWYDAIIEQGATSVTPVLVVPADESVIPIGVGDAPYWTDVNASFSVAAPAGRATGSVSVPCGRDVSVFSTAGTAKITTPSGTVDVGAFASRPISVACEGSAVFAGVTVETTSLASRTFNLVFRSVVAQ